MKGVERFLSMRVVLHWGAQGIVMTVCTCDLACIILEMPQIETSAFGYGWTLASMDDSAVRAGGCLLLSHCSSALVWPQIPTVLGGSDSQTLRLWGVRPYIQDVIMKLMKL